MLFPLLVRLDLDSIQRMKCYFVNANYGRDILPTRDRSLGSGSLWTFKCCYRQVVATDQSRGRLVPWAGIVFGEIDFVEPQGLGRIVRLKCPERASIQLAAAFRLQVQNMACVLNEDFANLPGAIVSSWTSALTQSVHLPYIPGTFYLNFPSTITDTPLLGSSIEATVFVERINSINQSNGEENYDGGVGIIVKFKCPADASCLARDLYDGQLRALQSILDVENGETGNDALSTWFTSPLDRDRGGNSSTGYFFFNVMAVDVEDPADLRDSLSPGLLLEVWVSMQRVDTAFPGGHKERNYSLTGRSLGLLERMDVSRKGRRYVCDRNEDLVVLYLSHFLPAGDGVYQTDFVANRVASTRDGTGSIFIYKPTGDYPLFSLNLQQKRSVGSYSMTFAGTIAKITKDPDFEGKPVYLVTLKSPENPNNNAVALIARQESALLAISKVDALDAGVPCVVKWGHPLAETQLPTVCVAIAHVKMLFTPLEVGDDVVLNARLKRVDTEVNIVNQVLEMRYFLEASVFGKLRSDQLRRF
ncbi:hypothetical protein C8R47DRAFT_1272478 [Mycena vitilis]|nr:hypothetical protein C8R47DRAFT_1272478 [Mycena vitilis]